MEGPPLWVWAFIIGIIIASKFIYRWTMTKELAKNGRQNNQSFNRIKGNEKAINDRKISGHKYDPQNFGPSRYKDYTAMRKKDSQNIK